MQVQTDKKSNDVQLLSLYFKLSEGQSALVSPILENAQLPRCSAMLSASRGIITGEILESLKAKSPWASGKFRSQCQDLQTLRKTDLHVVSVCRVFFCGMILFCGFGYPRSRRDTRYPWGVYPNAHLVEPQCRSLEVALGASSPYLIRFKYWWLQKCSNEFQTNSMRICTQVYTSLKK